MLLRTCAVAVLLSTPAWADWEADVSFKPRGGPTSVAVGQKAMETSGHGYFRKTRVRLDMQTPGGKVSSIIDQARGTVVLLMHERKLKMESDVNQSGVDTPKCDTQDIDKCLAANGYTKTGSEEANGHKCTVYSATVKTARGEATHKLWRPNDLKGVAFVRVQSTSGQTTGQMDLTNVKSGDLSDALFEVPAGYQTMQNPLAGGGQGAGGTGVVGLEELKGKRAKDIQDALLKQYGVKAPPKEPTAEE